MKKMFLFFGLMVINCGLLFAEEITITTYYPSPYGSYNELATNRLAVGDTNSSGGLDAADQPNRDGDIRLKAQAGDPAGWPAGTLGQIAYSSTNNSLYHYNSGAGVWLPVTATLETITGYRTFQGTIVAITGIVADFIAVGAPGTDWPAGGWGIDCNTANGWAKTGCSLATDNDPANRDYDVRQTANGCRTDNEETVSEGSIYINCARIQ